MHAYNVFKQTKLSNQTNKIERNLQTIQKIYNPTYI